jgi:hypothetical protein
MNAVNSIVVLTLARIIVPAGLLLLAGTIAERRRLFLA